MSKPIHDAKGKAAGYIKYAGDISLPNMAHISIVRSTIPHGYVKKVNAEKALALPGVYGVFDCFNTTKRKYNHYRSNFTQTLPEEERAFNDYVRFVGDRIAAVAACDQQTAERAAKLVEVEYEELPFSIDFDDTLAGKNCREGEKPVWDEFSAAHGEEPVLDGALEVESFSEMPRLHHATMETHACVADYDPFEGTLCVYSPNQAVHGIRVMLADYLEMPYHKVRVTKAVMGGSFGAKQEWFVEPVAALIARELGRPVKIVYSRAEAMIGSVVRGAMRAHVKSWFRPDGKLLALHMDVTLDAGAYIGNASDYVRTLYGKLFRCYRMPCARYHAQVISSNTPVSGAYRGWSAPEEAIMMEHHMDAAAKRLGIDRVELRRINAHLPGDCDEKSGISLENIRLVQALEEGKARFGWERLTEEDRAFNAANPRYRRGVGIGCGGHGSTYFPRYQDYGQGRLMMNEDGTVQAMFSIHDHGCGTGTMLRMILSEALDMPFEDIGFQEADTSQTPVDYGCFASRTTYVLGRTAYEAAQQLRENLLHSAAELYGVDERALYTECAHVRSKADTAFSKTYGEVARDSMERLCRNISSDAQYCNVTNPGVVGVHFAHVEVDTWTGYTKVLAYLAVQDIGKAINPGMCTAQIQGAVQMGCGAALREKMTIDKNGRCTESLSKYHLFLAPDLPNIEVYLLEDGASEQGPYGAKSIGEVCYVPVAPAVCSAVNAALDTALDVMPYDPDCILRHLAKERSK